MENGTCRKVADHVWLLRDEHNDTCYLVIGREKAALIDTMVGFVNVRELAERVTDLPLMVLNTHGHGDHVNGNVLFEEAMIHPADLPMVDEMIRDPEFIRETTKMGVKMSRMIPIRNGDLVDLGGLTLETVELPGHTPGSVCFLLREDRILFTGDSINRHLWMQLDGCTTIAAYANELGRFAEKVKGKADIILHGHASDAEPITLMDDLLGGLQQILDGKTEKDTDYHWFGGVAHQHPFAEGSVIVYAENIR